ncbi:MAG: hypothetical protein EHM87_18020, partial [Burkholderiales bacterium]
MRRSTRPLPWTPQAGPVARARGPTTPPPRRSANARRSGCAERPDHARAASRRATPSARPQVRPVNRPAVVLTQPAPRAAALAASLEARGLEVVQWPMTAIEAVPDLDWPHLAATLARCRWVLLPSPGAIDVVMGAFARLGLAWPASAGIGVIGPGSREVLDGWRARLP